MFVMLMYVPAAGAANASAKDAHDVQLLVCL